jgi:hypothetical protein
MIKEPWTNTYLGVEKGIESSSVHNEWEDIKLLFKNPRIIYGIPIPLTKNNIKTLFKIKKGVKYLIHP